MIPEDLNAQNLDRRVRDLGICWVLYGIVRVVTRILLRMSSNAASMMFGVPLNRVPDPFALMNLFHFACGLLVVVSVSCGILGVLAGLALLVRTPVGRTLARVAVSFPLQYPVRNHAGNV
jgi:hypothetical protein